MIEEVRLGILDIAILVTFVLFAIGGLKKGLFRDLRGVPILFGLLFAIVLTELVGTILFNTELGTIVFDALRGSVFTGDTLFGLDIAGYDPVDLTNQVTVALLNGVSFLAVLVLGSFLMWLVFKQLAKLSSQNGLVRFVDLFIGVLIGLVRATIVIAVTFTFAAAVYSAIPPSGLGIKPTIDSFLINDLSLDRPESFSIAKLIFNSLGEFLDTFGVSIL
jgi:hypothetical protein